MSHKPSGYHRPSRGSQAGHEEHFDTVHEHLLLEGDKIPFVDSADESDDGSGADGGGGELVDEDKAGGTSGNASDCEDDEDDVMTESQENLAMAYVNRYRMPSLAERRNQGKLTVTIENERNPPER